MKAEPVASEILSLTQFLFTGCSAVQGLFRSNLDGPPRTYLTPDETQAFEKSSVPDLTYYQSLSAAGKQSYRNDFITARMYLIDLAYHQYELSITRSVQDESFATAATTLGLTGAAALVPAAQTKAILAGVASGVTGLAVC
jgi:hypothetical protein